MAHVSFIPASKLVELLSAASAGRAMQVWVLSSNRLALGVDPLHPTSEIDLSKEVVRQLTQEPSKDDSVSSPPVVTADISERVSRRSGRHLLEFRGRITECVSLKQVLAEGLKVLEQFRPGTLDKLSGVKPRTKRIVARNAADLFDQTELSAKYSERLVDGWWYGTNNSADETYAWLKRACSLAGVEWGKDFVASEKESITLTDLGLT